MLLLRYESPGEWESTSQRQEDFSHSKLIIHSILSSRAHPHLQSLLPVPGRIATSQLSRQANVNIASVLYETDLHLF